MESQELDQNISKIVGGRYLLSALLGEGGMGKVYLATDTMLKNEQVAVKMLHPELCADEKLVQRFIREVQLCRRVANKNVVRAYDIGRHEETLFLTMEYVQGITLKEKLTEGALTHREASKILVQICRGLAAIHEADIIHRDLKPGNVIICPDGTVKIADFGVARPSGFSDITSHDEVIGSTPYMAPEVWIGKSIGPQADIYALGIIAYESITGGLPFDGDSPAEVMRKHLDVPPYPPMSVITDMPEWLNYLIIKMLAKEPKHRPQTASEVGEIIEKNLLSKRTFGNTGSSVIDADLLSVLEKAEQLHASSTQLKRPTNRDSDKIIIPTISQPSIVSSSNSSLVIKPTLSEQKTQSAEIFRVEPDPKNAINNLLKGINAQKARKKYLDKLSAFGPVFIQCIGTIVVTTAICIAMSMWGGPFAQGLWSSLTAHSNIISVSLTIAAFITLTCLVASAPAVVLGFGSTGIGRSISAWKGMLIKLLSLTLAMFLVYGTMIGFKSSQLGTVMTIERYKHALETSLQNVSEVALLFPEGTIYSTRVKFGGPVLVGTGSPSVFEYIPFLFLWSVMILLVYGTVKRRIYGFTSEKVRYAKILVPLSIIVPSLIEHAARESISMFFKWFSLRTHTIQLGSLNFTINEYSAICSIINWFILCVVVCWIIPTFAKKDENRKLG